MLRPNPKISFISWNIWSDRMYLDDRLKGICEIIEQKDPDFICLQDVCNNVLQKMLRMDWAKYYFVSNEWIDKTASGPNVAQIVFSKYPFTKNECFPFRNSSSHRKINIVDVNLPLNKVFPDMESGHYLNGTNLTLLNTQLEPLKLFSSVRKDQFYTIINFLMERKNVFICADTGFTDQDDDVLDIVDPWRDAHIQHLVKMSNEKGIALLEPDTSNIAKDFVNDWFTVNSEINTFVNGFNQYRFDRLIYKSQDWQMTHFELLGREPIKTINLKSKPIYPSSHFGIYCEFAKKPF